MYWLQDKTEDWVTRTLKIAYLALNNNHSLTTIHLYAVCVDNRSYLLLFIEDSDSEEETDKVNKCSLVWEVGSLKIWCKNIETNLTMSLLYGKIYDRVVSLYASHSLLNGTLQWNCFP